MITWVMVGLLLAAETCGRNVLSGNGNGKEESKQKDGLKGVATEEEDIYRLTCYTCVNVSDNQVSKSCVSSAECGPASVGCLPMDTQQICISCCDLSYCNIESPTNATNAIFSRKRRAKSKSKRKRPGRNGVEGSRFYGDGALWLLASLFYAYHC
ncbi:hypothetical protein QLX08_002418 [Tetragonisca angustula]|uniref:Ly6/PLAUR domain-containing protein 6B n=1 Tax=Tetragonisca angustula TaxID=166442 RepID=A0AAW1AAT5_9HYME